MFDTVSAAADPAPAGSGALTNADLEVLLAGLAQLDTAVTDADRVTQLDTLERIKAACAAAQVTVTAAFVDSQQQVAEAWYAQAAECSDRGDFEGWRAARDRARDAEFVPPSADAAGQDASAGAARRRQRGQHSRTGTAAQVGLARRESPARGARLVSTALALTDRLPHTLAALRAGLLNEHRAELVVSHTRHLSPTLQTLVDHQVIGAAGAEVGAWGTRELERRVRACADRLDAAAAAARAHHAETQRRVTLRPVPDTMAALTALLPVAQAVAVHTALTAAADRAKAEGDPRTKGQIMADTLVALVTGQAVADDVPIEIQVIITDRALLHGDTTPAHVPGYGPVPAEWVIDLITRHTTDETTTDTSDPSEPADPADVDPDATEPEAADPARPADVEPDATEPVAADPAKPANVEPDATEPEAADPAKPVNVEPDATESEDAGPTEPADAGPGVEPDVPDVADDSDGPPPPPTNPTTATGAATHDETDRGALQRLERAAEVWLRRLYTHPGTGTLVAMDSRRRLFPGGLRRFLTTRDGTCRTPWCNAAIRHADHIHPYARGGPTTDTNGDGLCIRCNLTRNLPGFQAHVTDPGPTAGSDHPHTITITTPTGHTYTSTAPPVLPLDDPLLRHDTTPAPQPTYRHQQPASDLTVIVDLDHWHRRRPRPIPESPLERHLAALIAN